MHLTQTPMTLAAYTPRTEKMGEGPDEPAASLSMKAQLSGKSLRQFFPSDAAFDDFAEAVWDDDGMPRHGITKIELDHELIGGICTLSTPQSKKPIELGKIDIKALSLTILEGHSAEAKIRINAHPSEAHAGLLSVSWLGKELLVTAERSLADAEKAGQQSMPLPVEREKAADDAHMPKDQPPPQRPRQAAKLN